MPIPHVDQPLPREPPGMVFSRHSSGNAPRLGAVNAPDPTYQRRGEGKTSKRRVSNQVARGPPPIKLILKNVAHGPK
jgi:hypothetical protein